MSEDPEPKKVNYCPYCGEELPELQEYCPGCGVKLTAGDLTPSSTAGEALPVQESIPAEKNPSNFIVKQTPPGLAAEPPVLRGIRCIHCKGTGFCKFCAGSGAYNRKECTQCGGTGRCMICQGRGVL